MVARYRFTCRPATGGADRSAVRSPHGSSPVDQSLADTQPAGTMSRPAAAALLYAPDGYDDSRPDLMGRHAAGAGLLGALVRHSDFDRLLAMTTRPEDGESFRRHVARLGATMPAEVLEHPGDPRLAQAGCLLLPGPDLGSHGWRRRRMAPAAAYSLVGITHTIASAAAMESIAALLTAPVQPWDALVCTSAAVRGAVRRLWAGEAAWLARRVGATRLEGPALPVIPLGVDTDALAPDPRARAEWRARLGIGPRDVAVLHHGRLSFHAKAHPLPMFLALARAASAMPSARVVLVLSGWFAGETQRRGFTEMARALAPSLVIRLVERPEAGTTLRAAADLFTLLSDNVQESFGLAPVEALAAGLPVVASDWDGLRDTIEHGVTGFRIPTLLAGPMPDLAARHEAGQDSYDQYIGGIAQFTAVDVGAAEAAFAALIGDAGLRARMAAAARAQAVARFGWAAVMAQYHLLWAELARLRGTGQAERAAPLRGEDPVPRHPDPSALFADYPTRRLAPETRLALAPGLADAEAALARVLALAAVKGVAARPELLPGAETFRVALDALATGPATAAVMVAALPPDQALRMHRALGWLVKVDVLRVAEGAA
jgi:glycosyltransferase involved in cell wall biosynthesis